MPEHTIEIIITPEGEIQSTVKGIAGPSCEGVTEWLKELGQVIDDKNTADYHCNVKPGIKINR